VTETIADGPAVTPVPHPERRIVTVIAEGQQITSEQRTRVSDWLRANGIDPRRVLPGPITVECKMQGDVPGRQVIGFWEFYEDADGRRVINERTLNEALKYERWVEQRVPLAPDPAWQGWDAWHAEHTARSDR